MGDVVLEEVFLVILLFVQPDHAGDAKLLKYFYVLFGVVAVPLVCISLLYRSHEGHEFAWNNPVGVTILNPFIELIFFYVESAEIIPFELDGVLEPLQTLEHGTLVKAVTL